MNKRDAKAFIKRLAPQCIYSSGHFRDRMKDRNVFMNDVLFLIMWGNVSNLEEDTEYNNWKCTVTGKDIEGDDLTVVMALDENAEAITCITVC